MRPAATAPPGAAPWEADMQETAWLMLFALTAIGALAVLAAALSMAAPERTADGALADTRTSHSRRNP